MEYDELAAARRFQGGSYLANQGFDLGPSRGGIREISAGIVRIGG